MTNYEEYDEDFLTANEVREDSDFEEVKPYEITVDEETEEDTGRVTEKPEIVEVDFTVHRAFTWHGERLEEGQHTWPEDLFNDMLYDVNLRTDRILFVTRD